VSYFAVSLARSGSKWSGEELSLDDVEDVDGLVDLALSVSPDAAAPILVAVEEDDEWLALVRIDSDADIRVFLSDTRVLSTSDVARVFSDALESAAENLDSEPSSEASDDDDDESGDRILDAEPGGDAGLLGDLGTPESTLLALFAKEGALPGDVTAAVCERAGCLDVYDSLRSA